MSISVKKAVINALGVLAILAVVPNVQAKNLCDDAETACTVINSTTVTLGQAETKNDVQFSCTPDFPIFHAYEKAVADKLVLVLQGAVSQTTPQIINFSMTNLDPLHIKQVSLNLACKKA